MNKLIVLTFLLISSGIFAGQITMIVVSLPENTPPEDHIFIAGSFNGWNPGNEDFILTENTSGQPEITIEGTGTISFKFTRGSWETVEGNENGGFLPDRSFTFGSADTLEIIILSWEDLGGTNHTAAENVIVMDEEFYMPQLDRHRRIWLYLPPDYDSSGKTYPVLYMHDGQNLFDAATSFAGEWEVDETLNNLYDEGKNVPIVVGIDNGGADRISEYTPWPNPQYGGGDGNLYAQFIVETLKPYIDQNFRTKPGRLHTGVMGSSLGGLISHYAGIKYQETFGKAGVFSPSYWFNDLIYDFTFETGKSDDMRIYVMGGTNESSGLVGEMMAMMDTLLATGFAEDEMNLKLAEGGQHNESLWRQQFAEAFQWMYPEGSAGIDAGGSNSESDIEIWIARGKLTLRENSHALNQPFRVSIYSMLGQEVYDGRISIGETIQLPETISGIYLILIINEHRFISQKVFLH
jgi:predicted alpha/beta superfamily hydrolase